MSKSPKTEKSRVKERKVEDKYETARSGNMDQIREKEMGKSFLRSSSITPSHNNTRIDASVTKKGKGAAVPNAQWEEIINVCPQGVPNTPEGAFLPMSGRIRPVPHKKTNECDY